jgi:hypothetical protein
MFMVEEACNELLNHLKLLGEASSYKQVIISGKLSCNHLKLLKNYTNHMEMEEIGVFLLKWLDKSNVEQGQHLLTSYIYAKTAKKSVGKVQKRIFFYQILFNSCTSNDKYADFGPLQDHHTSYHAFVCLHNIDHNYWQRIQSTALPSSLAQMACTQG